MYKWLIKQILMRHKYIITNNTSPKLIKVRLKPDSVVEFKESAAINS